MDGIRATPYINPLLGSVNELVGGLLGYMRDPRRTQQLQGLAGLLESTGVPKTLERLAYGEPLTNIQRANVPVLRPETAEALFTLSPVPQATSRAAMAAGRAGERMAERVVPQIMERGGMPAGLLQDLAQGSRSQITPQISQQMARAPQEEALRLAQQRAALPVEQGGLGLPKDNTPMDRARAMGYTTEGYRGSTVAETTHQNPLWWSEDPQYASAYAAHSIRPPKGQPDPYAGNVMPVLVNIGKSKEFEKFNVGGVPTDPFSGFKEGVETGFRRYAKNEVTGDMGGKIWEALTLPQNVRSRFAAFDPFRRTAAIAATMGVAAPDLLARTVDDEERRRQLLSGLLGP